MSDALKSSMLVLVLAVLPPLAVAAAGDWTADPAVQRRLAAGQVVVAAASVVDPEHPRGHVSAAVRIDSSPEAIWSVMTDCRQARLFVPGLKGCRRIDGASDGSWEDIEHEVRYSWWLPTVRYVFRAQYDRPHRIDTRRISGDLKEEEGTWRLTPAADAAATIVEYEVYIDPGFWIPQALITRSLRKDLPAALAGLRDRVESSQVAAQQIARPAQR
jgi:ribosome-associated toxin RatA of RatAB toxin-antitoxin module